MPVQFFWLVVSTVKWSRTSYHESFGVGPVTGTIASEDHNISRPIDDISAFYMQKAINSILKSIAHI